MDDDDTRPDTAPPESSALLPAVAGGEAPERRHDDAELRAFLADRGFEGPEYEMFEDHLSAYAVPVMVGWIRTKEIIGVCGRRRVPGTRALSNAAALYWPDFHEAEDLALTTVVKALPLFRRKGLVEGEWRPDRGASLTTYFMGTCAHVFPDVYRLWKRVQERRRVYEESPGPTADIHNVDPLHRVLAREELREQLPQDTRTRAVVVLHAWGYSNVEIAEILAPVSARAVEGVLYRFRLTHETRRAGR